MGHGYEISSHKPLSICFMISLHKPLPLHMEPNSTFNDKYGVLLEDPSQYIRLIGGLLYLTISRSSISFVDNMKGNLGQGILFPSNSNLNVLAYLDDVIREVVFPQQQKNQQILHIHL